MHLVNPGPAGTGTFWRCLECPDGQIGHGGHEEEATSHTRYTGHSTEYGRLEWQLLYPMRTEAPLPAVRSEPSEQLPRRRPADHSGRGGFGV